MTEHPLRVVRMTHEDAHKRGKRQNGYLLSLALHFRMGCLFTPSTVRRFKQEDGELVDITLDVRGMSNAQA